MMDVMFYRLDEIPNMDEESFNTIFDVNKCVTCDDNMSCSSPLLLLSDEVIDLMTPPKAKVYSVSASASASSTTSTAGSTTTTSSVSVLTSASSAAATEEQSIKKTSAEDREATSLYDLLSKTKKVKKSRLSIAKFKKYQKRMVVTSQNSVVRFTLKRNIDDYVI